MVSSPCAYDESIALGNGLFFLECRPESRMSTVKDGHPFRLVWAC